MIICYEMGRILKPVIIYRWLKSEMLLTVAADPAALSVQLVRWAKAGKIIQVKRGVTFSARFSKNWFYEPIWHRSYQTIIHQPWKGIRFHGFIRGVPVYTSVTTKRSGRFITQLGYSIIVIYSPPFLGISVHYSPSTDRLYCPGRKSLPRLFLSQKELKSLTTSWKKCVFKIVNHKQSDSIAYAQRFKNPAFLHAKTLQK